MSIRANCFIVLCWYFSLRCYRNPNLPYLQSILVSYRLQRWLKFLPFVLLPGMYFDIHQCSLLLIESLHFKLYSSASHCFSWKQLICLIIYFTLDMFLTETELALIDHVEPFINEKCSDGSHSYYLG